ncbi:hypothetical protein [Streptomyces sp. CS113]|uniref:hypothetical protein n=1 Tax=Streptomyces sp. CS113 TaxID=1982761 RepID=UPI00117E57C6|nr:hypothetical protein [Streptomyces sp. CS113]
MPGHNRRPPCPPLFRLEFAAFCEANRNTYLRYAHARLGDQADARQCVGVVLGDLGPRWIATLGSASPAARAWGDLRAETKRRTTGAAKRPGQLHTVLREDQADIMLLHHHLRLPVDAAAGFMGLASPEARALLRGAERDLDNLHPSHCG